MVFTATSKGRRKASRDRAASRLVRVGQVRLAKSVRGAGGRYASRARSVRVAARELNWLSNSSVRWRRLAIVLAASAHLPLAPATVLR